MNNTSYCIPIQIQKHRPGNITISYPLIFEYESPIVSMNSCCTTSFLVYYWHITYWHISSHHDPRSIHLFFRYAFTEQYDNDDELGRHLGCGQANAVRYVKNNIHHLSTPSTQILFNIYFYPYNCFLPLLFLTPTFILFLFHPSIHPSKQTVRANLPNFCLIWSMIRRKRQIYTDNLNMQTLKR